MHSKYTLVYTRAILCDIRVHPSRHDRVVLVWLRITVTAHTVYYIRTCNIVLYIILLPISYIIYAHPPRRAHTPLWPYRNIHSGVHSTKRVRRVVSTVYTPVRYTASAIFVTETKTRPPPPPRFLKMFTNRMRALAAFRRAVSERRTCVRCVYALRRPRRRNA